jgi:hypothetical protein
MKTEVICVLFVSLLLLGCPLPPPPPGNNTTASCPSTCQLGCLPDNVTCISPTNKCAGVVCKDKCEDTSVLDTNGLCNNATGICIYKKMVCVFGCAKNSCTSQPPCQVNCPFGCEPGTDICSSQTCPGDCTYGCVPGTLQCNSVPPSAGIRNGDFEEGYAGWNVSGNAFGSAPTNAALINSEGFYLGIPYSGYSGAYFASSYFPQMNKRAIGNLTSEPFFINKKYLEFLVVADYSGGEYVDLIVNGTVVEHINPDNPYAPFEKITWNVSEYAGQSGIINVVDFSVSASIDVDDFRLVETPSLRPGEPYIDRYRNFSIVPPSQWLQVNPNVQGEIFFYGPENNNVTVQLAVVSEKVNANETTETYFAKGKKEFSMLLQNYSAVSESNITINGLDARQVDYTYTVLGVKTKSREAFLVYNRVGYRITGTAAESSFGTYADDFSKSIKSFTPSAS